MVHQPGVAIRTGEAKTAAAAERERRIAPAIEKEEGLLAAFERGAHGLSQTRRDEAAARRAFRAQIDGFDHRKMLTPEALGKIDGDAWAAEFEGALRRRGPGFRG